MHKRPTLATFKELAMQNEEFKKEYELLASEYEMTKRPTFESFMKIAMQNEEFKKEYERLAPEYELIAERIEARIAKAALKVKAKIEEGPSIIK